MSKKKMDPEFANLTKAEKARLRDKYVWKEGDLKVYTPTPEEVARADALYGPITKERVVIDGGKI